MLPPGSRTANTQRHRGAAVKMKNCTAGRAVMHPAIQSKDWKMKLSAASLISLPVYCRSAFVRETLHENTTRPAGGLEHLH
jgi:hypothetical protein